MDKIRMYFSYFNKYYNVQHWHWYKQLNHWISISTKIKDLVIATDFTSLTESEIDNKLLDILTEGSMNALNSTEDFFQRYLFLQDNGLGDIGQGVIWDSENHKHKSIIISRLNSRLFIELLNADIDKADSLLEEILQNDRNYPAAKIRFLRALFPEKFAAVDAPNKLDRLLGILESKLGIMVSGSIIQRHNLLMDLIDSNDIALKQIFFWELYHLIDDNLTLKKSIVYYGAPGTGKTYSARRKAKIFIDLSRIKIARQLDDYLIQTIQFHPSFAYEDFIEGIRPDKNGNLQLHMGVFKSFCKDAGKIEIALYNDDEFFSNESFKNLNYDFNLIKLAELTEKQRKILDLNESLPSGMTISDVIDPAFFIIDEINRAELSRVFGELMYSLEYRGYNGKIKTQYSYLNKERNTSEVYYWENESDWFFIPQNLYIIGTMNNIDRSVDSFDFALRRRFLWEEIVPDFSILNIHLSANWVKNLIISFEQLNAQISKDDLFGSDYRIGHAYALAIKPLQDKFETLNEARDFLWNDTIKPLLQEYLRGLGNQSKAEEKLKNFQNAFYNNRNESE